MPLHNPYLRTAFAVTAAWRLLEPCEACSDHEQETRSCRCLLADFFLRSFRKDGSAAALARLSSSMVWLPFFLAEEIRFAAVGYFPNAEDPHFTTDVVYLAEEFFSFHAVDYFSADKKFLADAADFFFVFFLGEFPSVWFGSCSGEAVFFFGDVVAFLFFFAKEARFADAVHYFHAEDPHFNKAVVHITAEEFFFSYAVDFNAEQKFLAAAADFFFDFFLGSLREFGSAAARARLCSTSMLWPSSSSLLWRSAPPMLTSSSTSMLSRSSMRSTTSMMSKKFLAAAADFFVYFFGELQRVCFGNCSGEAVFFNVVAFLFFFAEEFRFFFLQRTPTATKTPSTSMLSRSSPPAGVSTSSLGSFREVGSAAALASLLCSGPFTDDDTQVDRFDFYNVTLTV
jgi:hypothetical protein